MISTSIEESRALLDAGISPETADMWRTIVQPLKQNGWLLVNDGEPYEILSLYKGEHTALASFEDIPTWSLSALWTLCKDKQLKFDTDIDSAEGVMHTLVNALTK